MAFDIKFNEEKNQLLIATRKISFEDVIKIINNKKLLANKLHHNQKFSHQKIYVVEINKYAYIVPYVVNKDKKEIFLKTIYPSRVLTKRYIRKDR
jgi:hypothetical protein